MKYRSFVPYGSRLAQLHKRSRRTHQTSTCQTLSSAGLVSTIPTTKCHDYPPETQSLPPPLIPARQLIPATPFADLESGLLILQLYMRYIAHNRFASVQMIFVCWLQGYLIVLDIHYDLLRHKELHRTEYKLSLSLSWTELMCPVGTLVRWALISQKVSVYIIPNDHRKSQLLCFRSTFADSHHTNVAPIACAQSCPSASSRPSGNYRQCSL